MPSPVLQKLTLNLPGLIDRGHLLKLILEKMAVLGAVQAALPKLQYVWHALQVWALSTEDEMSLTLTFGLSLASAI